MKILPILVFALALLPLSCASAAEKRVVNLRIEMQIVAVPEELALPLIPDLMSKEKIDPAYVTIQDFLAKGLAQLVGWPFVTTQSGQRALIEAIDEIRYPTKFAPPVISFTSDVDKKEPVTVERKVDLTNFAAVPSEFETRNTGVTLEVEPVLSPDGKMISLNIVPQHVRLNGYRKTTIERPDTGAKVVVEQPDFNTMKVTTSLIMRNGERVLMGTFRTNDPPRHIEFFFLKVEAIPVD